MSVVHLPIFTSIIRALRAIASNRRPLRIEKVARTNDCEKFLTEAFVISGGNLANAASFLDTKSYRETRIGFLIARCLDAFEDLSMDYACAASGIQQFLDYLEGRCQSPPMIDGLSAKSESDDIELLILERVTFVKAGFDSLDEQSRRRITELANDIGKIMLRAFGQRRSLERSTRSEAEYGKAVLGRVARFCLEATGVRSRDQSYWGPIGQICQAANDLKDLELDYSGESVDHIDFARNRLSLLINVLANAPLMPSFLADLDFSANATAKPACVFVTLTTTRFFVTANNYKLRGLIKHPFRSAIMCSLFESKYRRFVLEIEHIVSSFACDLKPIFGAQQQSDLSCRIQRRRSRYQSEYDSLLIRHFGNSETIAAVQIAVELARFAYRVATALPNEQIDPNADQRNAGYLIMIIDFLLARAICHLRGQREEVTQRFSELMCRLSRQAVEDGGATMEFSEISGFIYDVLIQQEYVPATHATQRSKVVDVSAAFGRIDNGQARFPAGHQNRLAQRQFSNWRNSSTVTIPQMVSVL